MSGDVDALYELQQGRVERRFFSGIEILQKPLEIFEPGVPRSVVEGLPLFRDRKDQLGPIFRVLAPRYQALALQFLGGTADLRPVRSGGIGDTARTRLPQHHDVGEDTPFGSGEPCAVAQLAACLAVNETGQQDQAIRDMVWPEKGPGLWNLCYFSTLPLPLDKVILAAESCQGQIS